MSGQNINFDDYFKKFTLNLGSETGNIINEKIDEVKHEVDYKINETKKKIEENIKEAMYVPEKVTKK